MTLVEGSSEEAIRKATEAAVAKFYSKKKKSARVGLQQSALKLLEKNIADKWCPRLHKITKYTEKKDTSNRSDKHLEELIEIVYFVVSMVLGVI